MHGLNFEYRGLPISPNSVRVAAIDASNLTFVWNESIQESSDFSDAIVYNINASNYAWSMPQ